MLTQAKADELLARWKDSVREQAFVWERDQRHEELFVMYGEEDIKFCLSLVRNPFELKAHFRTREMNIGLARIDDQLQHHNPDGSVIHGPHIHWYREGSELRWAEAINWYDANNPLSTLARFLDEVHARFKGGLQGAIA